MPSVSEYQFLQPTQTVPGKASRILARKRSVAAALGEPPLETLQDAAAEILGGKIPPAELRAAVSKGYRCRS